MEKQWFVAGVGSLIVVLAVVVLWYSRAEAPVPGTQIQESMQSVSTTTAESLQSEVKKSVPQTSKLAPAISKFPISPADTIASWNFKGVYTGNDTLIVKADADIAHLKSLIGKGQYDDYDLYIGIGNAAGLIGDGENAYKNYNRAASIYPDKGLAYANLGHLMDLLGAYRTAADAYAKAATVEPIPQYKNAQLDYLTWRFPEEAARLKVRQ
jgi:hypothetical protein